MSLKLECDKLASEKSEMQRHYVMYYEMSYGLNIEMHKQETCNQEEVPAGSERWQPKIDRQMVKEFLGGRNTFKARSPPGQSHTRASGGTLRTTDNYL
ncbi:TLE family member 5 [Varanus komodoensis]|nr:TLE family member 5 [Varanus komodoensis]